MTTATAIQHADSGNSPPAEWSFSTLRQDLTRFTYFRGRVALSAILRALGIGRGDEVLLQAFTCVAVPEGIMSVGAKPVYVDIASGTPNMDPLDLAGKIGDRTKAVIIQHSYGMPADVVELTRIARERGVSVIEDCAHTIASRVNNRFVGSFGDAAFYSYEAAKPVFAGFGGSAIINSPELRRIIESDYGSYEEPPILSQLETAAMVYAYRIAYRPWSYWTVRSVFRALSKAGIIRGNYNKVGLALRPASDFRRRLGRVQKSVLIDQLGKLESQTIHRQKCAERYRATINSRAVDHFAIPHGFNPVFGRYPMIAHTRKSLIEKVRGSRIETAVFYDTPVQPLSGSALRDVGYEPGSCPQAEYLADRIISLPTGLQVSDAQLAKTADFFNRQA